jgi:site-specific DNA-cytosine methylase
LGLLMKGKNGHAPLEFILNGVRKDAAGRTVKYGLNYLENYIVLDPVTMRSADLGLPMVRGRVFIILIRKDIVMKCCLDVTQINSFIDYAKENPLPTASLIDFLADSDSDNDVEQPGARRRTPSSTFASTTMTAASAIGSTMFRNEHRLPSRHAPGGQPFSASVDLARVDLSARQRDVVDCAWLLHRRSDGSVPETLVIDVSQSVSRMPWKNDGFVQSLHLGGKIVVQGKIMKLRALFRIMGWPRAQACDIRGLTGNAVRKLTGNMIATPVIGVVLLAVLLEVRL